MPLLQQKLLKIKFCLGSKDFKEISCIVFLIILKKEKLQRDLIKLDTMHSFLVF